MLQLLPTTPVVPLKKLYWGKYPFRIVLKFRIKKKTRYAYMDFKQSNKLQGAINPHLPEKGKFRTTDNGYTITYYFQDKDKAQEVATLAENTSFIVIDEISRPNDEAHLALLLDDHKVITRKAYFFQKYQWCIVLRSIDFSEHLFIYQWASEYFDVIVDDRRNYETAANDRVLLSKSHVLSKIYLKEEDDVIMTKLVAGTMIKRVEKVVLLEETPNITTITKVA